MINTIDLTSIKAHSLQFFSCEKELLRSILLANFKYSIINYYHHAVYYIPFTYEETDTLSTISTLPEKRIFLKGKHPNNLY